MVKPIGKEHSFKHQESRGEKVEKVSDWDGRKVTITSQKLSIKNLTKALMLAGGLYLAYSASSKYLELSSKNSELVNSCELVYEESLKNCMNLHYWFASYHKDKIEIDSGVQSLLKGIPNTGDNSADNLCLMHVLDNAPKSYSEYWTVDQVKEYVKTGLPIATRKYVVQNIPKMASFDYHAFLRKQDPTIENPAWIDRPFHTQAGIYNLCVSSLKNRCQSH